MFISQSQKSSISHLVDLLVQQASFKRSSFYSHRPNAEQHIAKQKFECLLSDSKIINSIYS